MFKDNTTVVNNNRGDAPRRKDIMSIDAATHLEHIIIRVLVEDMAKAGFVPVSVFDGEEYVPELIGGAIPDVMPIEEIIDAVYAVDDYPTIHFAPADGLGSWGNLGVLVVAGNGCDLISDYHCGNEKFSAVI